MLNWLKTQLQAVPEADAEAGRRSQRIQAEVQMVAGRFSQPPYQGVYYDEEHHDWFIIPNYPLPARFRQRRCDLLIVFPETYPETPPIGFYLNQRFKLSDNTEDAHLTGRAYHNAPDLTSQGWHWYCVTMDMNTPGAWSPKPDHRQPDNLWTFLTMVREALTNDQ
ncbi:MAG: hypothetical protein JXA21_00210 [Anaerolineae bacterium]|nr:hypothetical protein [Anaerolineae bacterium]